MPYFNFPFLPYNFYKQKYNLANPTFSNKPSFNPTENIKNDVKSVSGLNFNIKNNSKNNEDYFFELFGIKLYFDDILILTLLFFLYQEGIKDDDLFFSLLLLLLS